MQALNLTRLPRASKISYFPDRLLGQFVTIAISYGAYGAAIDEDELRLPAADSDAASCKAAKEKFSSAEHSRILRQSTESLQKSVTDFLAAQANLASEYSKYLEALTQRRSTLQDKLNSSQTALQIGSSLPLLLAILAVACIATISGVKLFDVEIQMEWVASGQVIQFVTVMILLRVILALGLSNILKENTLGTLLGGVAGYVLAQGVGRAAARDVARSRPILPPAGPPPPPAGPAPIPTAPAAGTAPAPVVPPAVVPPSAGAPLSTGTTSAAPTGPAPAAASTGPAPPAAPSAESTPKDRG
jgi:hypothetical protein